MLSNSVLQQRIDQATTDALHCQVSNIGPQMFQTEQVVENKLHGYFMKRQALTLHDYILFCFFFSFIISCLFTFLKEQKQKLALSLIYSYLLHNKAAYTKATFLYGATLIELSTLPVRKRDFARQNYFISSHVTLHYNIKPGFLTVLLKILTWTSLKGLIHYKLNELLFASKCFTYCTFPSWFLDSGSTKDTLTRCR